MKNSNIRIVFTYLFLVIAAFPLLSLEDQSPLLKERGNRKLDYFFLEAIKQKQNNQHSNAFRLFRHCLEIDSTSSAAHYEISNYYLFLKRADLVVNHLEKAVQYSPDNFDYKIALANVSRELGMNEEAVKAYEELAQTHSDKPELHYFLSEVYAKQGNTEGAIKALDTLEENIGMNEGLSIRKYRLYTEIEQQSKANREIEKLAEKYPTNAKYPIMMGDLYLEQNQPEKAYENYQKAYAIDSGNPYYTVSMANYYEYIQDKEAAQQQIDLALRNRQLDIETKLGILVRYIATLQRDKKDTQGVDTLFHTLMELHPQETELNLLYANYLMSTGKTEEAKFQYQVITETSPEEEAAWKQLLGINLKEENMEKVIRICKKAQLHFPDQADYYFYEGLAYYQLKDYAQALSVFKEGEKKVNPKDTGLLSDFHGQIADLYYHLGNKEKAYKHYDLALQYNDKNIGVMNNYAYFLTLDKKDLRKAERMSAQCVQAQPDNSTFIDTYAWIFFVQGNYSLAKFYIESAISKGGDKSSEIIDHYGDILYHAGNQEKAFEQWQKALELGKDTEIIRKKISEKTYYEDTEAK